MYWGEYCLSWKDQPNSGHHFGRGAGSLVVYIHHQILNQAYLALSIYI